MSTNAKAIEGFPSELAGEAVGENPSRDELLLAMILRLDERLTLLESEPSARRQAVADEDLEPRPAGNWVSVKEAAYQANRSAAWVRKWRSRGEIREHHEGGNVLVEIGDVLKRALVRC